MSENRISTRLVAFFLVTGAGLLLAGCSEPPPETKVVSRPVKMLTVSPPEGGRQLEYPGEVAAAQESVLAFEVSGRLVELPVDEGQEVTEGQLLARLDERDFQSNVNAAQSDFEAAASNFQRAQKMLADGFISQADFDSLKSRNDSTQANLEKAQKALQDSSLKAPFSGVIAKRYVENFTNVAAKQDIVMLHNQGGMEIDIGIPENDLRYSSTEQTNAEAQRIFRPKVIVSAFPDKVFDAQIKSFSTTADQTTRTFGATFSFVPDGTELVLPGMTAKVLLSAPENNTLNAHILIPAGALSAKPDGSARVWLVDINAMTVAARDVQLGEIQGDRVEVKSGLGFGDTIAVSGVHHLYDGMPVTRYQ